MMSAAALRAFYGFWLAGELKMMASQTDQGVNFKTNMHVSFLLPGRK
jgi:hypothetical protein